MQAAYCTRVPWLVGFLGHINPAARSTAGRLLGMVAAALQPAAAQALLEELVDKARNPEDTGGKAARFEDRDGAITALGFVLAQCAATGGAPPDAVVSAAAALCTALTDRTPHLAAAAAAALGFAGLRAPLPLPEGEATPTEKPTADGDAPSAPGAMQVDAAPPSPSRALVAERVAVMMQNKNDHKVVHAGPNRHSPCNLLVNTH